MNYKIPDEIDDVLYTSIREISNKINNDNMHKLILSSSPMRNNIFYDMWKESINKGDI
jgi:hypothetical protein